MSFRCSLGNFRRGPASPKSSTAVGEGRLSWSSLFHHWGEGVRLSKTLWSYCFYRCLTWNLYIWVMSFNLVGVCLRNREIQAKQAHYETTNSLYATRRRQRRMKSAAGIQKCCGLAVFICVTNWWLDEWIIIIILKIIYSMAPSQEGMMHRELQSRLTSLAEVAGVRGHFGTCAATSENCQTIQDRWASTQVVVLHRS